MKLSNIRLLVNDFDSAFTFYKETLGLACTWGKPGENFASFNIGITSGIALFRAELMQQVTGGSHTEAAHPSPDKAVIVVEVEDVTTVYQELKKRGVNFMNEPMDMPAWGIRVVHFRDQENNLFELFSDLPKEQWEDHLIEQEKILLSIKFLKSDTDSKNAGKKLCLKSC